MALYYHRGTASSTEKVIKTQPECGLFYLSKILQKESNICQGGITY